MRNPGATERAWEVCRDALPWPAGFDPERVSYEEAIADDRLTRTHHLALRMRNLRDAVLREAADTE